MKKILLTTLIFFSGASVQAQSLLNEAELQDAPQKMVTIKHLDILVYDPRGEITMKSEYEYDTNDNQIMSASYEWNIYENEWQGISKYAYAYVKNKKIREIQYSWSYHNKDWGVSLKTEYEYDAKGNKISETHYAWGKEVWHEVSKHKYEYNTYSYLINYISYNYSAVKGWIENDQVEYIYDAKGNLIKEVFYNWINGYRKEEFKYESEYNNKGKRIREISYHMGKNSWTKMNKYEYTYDSKGNQTKKISYYWHNEMNDWITSSKFEYNYDAKGNQTQKTVYDWYDFLNNWIRETQYKCVYNADGKPTEKSYYIWNYDNNSWMGDQKYVYTYDTEGKQSEGNLCFWDADKSNWYIYSTSSYNYSTRVGLLPSSQETVQPQPQLALYPNPVQTELYLQGLDNPTQVSIYNPNGQLLLQQHVQPGSSIYVGNLPKGFYLIKVNGMVLKLIKE